MVSVKDVSLLHQTCTKANNIMQNMSSASIRLQNNMQTKMDSINEEVCRSNALVVEAKMKVSSLEMEVAALAAGLPQTAAALEMKRTELALAMKNLAYMEERLSLAQTLQREFMIFYEKNISELNANIERFNYQIDSLNARINHAVDVLNNYFNTKTPQGSNEYKKQKSQYFEYQKLLYKKDKANLKDVENAYIEKLNAKKDGFIISKRANELGVEISQYNMPEFKSCFETKISINDFDKERYIHDKIANQTLKENLANNEALRSKFNSRQLEQIENNLTPDGYTWHHDGNPPPGRMQLVDTHLHNCLRHTGGYSLWCERV